MNLLNKPFFVMTSGSTVFLIMYSGIMMLFDFNWFLNDVTNILIYFY